jgi:DNA polymerase III gamma/tau subunit
LIDDEMYAELVDIVANRRVTEVFPFVSRLAEAGADLAEFANGAGEVLRALLISLLGGKPEGLTDVLRGAIEQHSDALTAGDVLRMLKLLGAAEGTIRRSPSSRLHIETLLVQWTMLDRTVELSEVMRALGGNAGDAPGQRRAGRGQRQTVAGRPPEKALRAAVARSARGELSLEGLTSAWDAILETVGSRQRMLREALGHAQPLEVAGDSVVLQVSDSAVHFEGLERSRRKVEEVIGEVLGVSPVRVEYRSDCGAANANSATPKRLDRNADQQERLRLRRERNPALDAIAEALDLEVIE